MGKSPTSALQGSGAVFGPTLEWLHLHGDVQGAIQLVKIAHASFENGLKRVDVFWMDSQVDPVGECEISIHGPELRRDQNDVSAPALLRRHSAHARYHY